MARSSWVGVALILVPLAAASQEFVFVEAEAIPPPPPSAYEEASVYGLQVSADGAHLYALYDVAIGDDEMLVYARGADGALALVDSPLGPANPNAMVLAPDGSAAFAVSNNGELWAWRRDAGTGLLTYADSEYDGGGGVTHLQYAQGIATSPDGRHLYVTGENAVTTFGWDAVAGTLALADTDVSGEGNLVLSTPGPVEVTPDGRFVVVASLFDNALVVFARDAGTGALTFADRFVDGAGGVNGLNGPSDIVAVADAGVPDHASVYVSSRSDATVAIFSEQSSGVAFVAAVPIGSFPTALAVNAAGTRLYVTDTILNRVAAVPRDPATGALGAIAGAVADADPGVNGLAQPYFAAASPDGANVYVASSSDDAIAVLATPAPEPATAAAGVAALAAVAALARRGWRMP